MKQTPKRFTSCNWLILRVTGNSFSVSRLVDFINRSGNRSLLFGREDRMKCANVSLFEAKLVVPKTHRCCEDVLCLCKRWLTRIQEGRRVNTPAVRQSQPEQYQSERNSLTEVDRERRLFFGWKHWYKLFKLHSTVTVVTQCFLWSQF